MVGSCAALNCTRKGAPGISFHRFPHRNPELLTKWVHNMKRSDISVKTKQWVPNEHSLLCSKHFDESCFVVRPGKRGHRLTDGAIPTKFTYGKSYYDKPKAK